MHDMNIGKKRLFSVMAKKPGNILVEATSKKDAIEKQARIYRVRGATEETAIVIDQEPAISAESMNELIEKKVAAKTKILEKRIEQLVQQKE